MKSTRNALRPVSVLTALLALWPGAAVIPAEPGAPGHAVQELDEVLVLGEQPGPAMWKVSRDGHTMWVMATLSPAPAKMTWRSKQVEAVIQHSGEVLGSTSARASFDIGLFGALSLIPAAMRARNNPDGSTLHDALPSEVYTRWSAMYRRFFRDDPDPKERRRPLFAADELYRKALDSSGLTPRGPVWPTVEKLAKQHKVRIREKQFDVPLQDPKGMIADLALVARDKEVACLVKTLDYIDQELPNIKQRARAWAVGDMTTLRALPPAVNRDDCFNALLDALRPRIEDKVEKVRSDITADRSDIFSWMVLAHETSFTTMPLEELLRVDGAVARWRVAGYTVEEPR